MINENIIKGQWKIIKGELQKKWGALTNDELDKVQGNVKALEGLMQKKLGLKQDQAKSELNHFFDKFDSNGKKAKGDYRDTDDADMSSDDYEDER